MGIANIDPLRPLNIPHYNVLAALQLILVLKLLCKRFGNYLQ